MRNFQTGWHCKVKKKNLQISCRGCEVADWCCLVLLLLSNDAATCTYRFTLEIWREWLIFSKSENGCW